MLLKILKGITPPPLHSLKTFITYLGIDDRSSTISKPSPPFGSMYLTWCSTPGELLHQKHTVAAAISNELADVIVSEEDRNSNDFSVPFEKIF